MSDECELCGTELVWAEEIDSGLCVDCDGDTWSSCQEEAELEHLSRGSE